MLLIKQFVKKLIRGFEKLDENALVSGSKFENFLAQIISEQETNLNSELNLKRRRDLLKSICSVYLFLRKTIMPWNRELSVEEFEVAKNKLDEMAKEALKKRRHKVLGSIGFKTAWSYYAKFGYFPIKRTPFGNWYTKHGWFKRRSPFWNNFNPYSYIDEYLSSSWSLPPNARALLDELFQKKFGATLIS